MQNIGLSKKAAVDINFKVLSLTRLGIKHEPTVRVSDVLFNVQLISDHLFLRKTPVLDYAMSINRAST